ncbi:MAG: DUF1727 domain-containing protein, partial [Dehalococcoidia bacterium]
QVSAAFGRLEKFKAGDKAVCLILVKNPSGFNEVLRLLRSDVHPKSLVLALNDKIADGRDVSWIWDVDMEGCWQGTGFVVAAGVRAHDMALRLKYAGLAEGDPPTPRLAVERDVFKAFRMALEATPPAGTLYVLPTYTAMLELREALAHAGHLKPYWRES